MSIQRLNFNALSNGGDNPSDAFRKLDGNDADLQNRIDALNNGNGFGSAGSVNIPNGYLQVGRADNASGGIYIDSNYPGYAAVTAASHAEDVAHGTSIRGGLFSSNMPERGRTALFFLQENIGQNTQATISVLESAWHEFYFKSDGSAYCEGSWVNGSDRRIKSDLELIPHALEKVSKLKGYTGKKLGRPMAALIAQDLKEVLPEGVSVVGDITLDDGSVVKDVLGIDASAVIALLVNAFNELSTKVKSLQRKVDLDTSSDSLAD